MVEKIKIEAEVSEDDGDGVDPKFIDGIDEEYEGAKKKKRLIRRILAVIMIIILGIYLLRFY